VPRAAACSAHTLVVQRVGDVLQAADADSLDICRTIGSTFAAKASAVARLASCALACAAARLVRLPSNAAALRPREPCALGNQVALLLGQSGIDVFRQG
jgi:hypothetical protein